MSATGEVQVVTETERQAAWDDERHRSFRFVADASAALALKDHDAVSVIMGEKEDEVAPTVGLSGKSIKELLGNHPTSEQIIELAREAMMANVNM